MILSIVSRVYLPNEVNLKRVNLFLINVIILINSSMSAANSLINITTFTNLTIDGDLSDWPTNIQEYPLDGSVGRENSENELTATYSLGYNSAENIFYICLKIPDTDINHAVLVNNDINFLWNNTALDALFIRLYSKDNIVDLATAGKNILYHKFDEDIPENRVGISQGNGNLIYELSFSLDELFKHWDSDKAISLDLSVRDVDLPEALPDIFFYASPKLINKKGLASENGKIHIVTSYEKSKTIYSLCPININIEGIDDFVHREYADSSGSLTLNLPVGKYGIFTTDDSKITRFEVEKDKNQEVKILVPPVVFDTLNIEEKTEIETGQGEKRGSWITYGISDGWAPQTVGAMMQDSDGVLWLGSGAYEGDGSISTYDGQMISQVRKFSSLDPDFRVHDFHQDKTGFIWIVTNIGLIGYREFKYFLYKNLPFEWIYCIEEDRHQRLWFLTEKGIWGLNEEGFFFSGFSSPNSSVMAVDPNKGIWLNANGNEKLIHFDYDNLHETQEIVIPQVGSYPITDITLSNDGVIWVSTDGHGIRSYDGANWTDYSDVFSYNFEKRINCAVEGSDGSMWFGTWGGGILHFYKNKWSTIKPADGLANTQVFSIIKDRNGSIWAGSMGGDVSRYIGNLTKTFNSQNGLIDDLVLSVAEGIDGSIWFATPKGLSFLKDATFTHFTKNDGLPSNYLTAIFTDKRGNIWTGSNDAGMSRFDGEKWDTWDIKMGRIVDIEEDNKGHIWATDLLRQLFHYDGNEWEKLDFPAIAISCGKNGMIWVTGPSGVSRNFENKWEHFPDFRPKFGYWFKILVSIDSNVWLGAWEGRRSLAKIEQRNNEQDIIYLPNDTLDEDFLPHDEIISIMEDHRGKLWIGTWGGGVTLWDGIAYQHLQRPDGLPNHQVQNIIETIGQDIWVSHEAGATRFRPHYIEPDLWIRSVLTADGDLGSELATVQITDSPGFMEIEVGAKSPNCDPKRIKYLYRLLGKSEEWVQTDSTVIRFTGMLPGNYQFEIKAVDTFLNYSQTIYLPIEVTIDYVLYGFSLGSGGLICCVVFFAIQSVRRRKKLRVAEQALIKEMEKELQVAHDLQMGLVPIESPSWTGYNISGRCIPATQVGGDLYQYSDAGLTNAITLADVTGHGMKAAVPAMVFSGILNAEMQYGNEHQDLFERLNNQLHGLLERRTFICCSITFFDKINKKLTIASAGLPCPLHYKRREQVVQEVVIEALPFGIRQGVQYEWKVLDVEPGDRLILSSDGLIEVEDETGDLFGYERFSQAILEACRSRMNPDEILDFIYEKVAAFDASEEQADDRTMVVIEVDGPN